MSYEFLNTTTAPEAASAADRAEFFDALQHVVDGFSCQIDRLRFAATTLIDDGDKIKNQNAGHYVARLAGIEGNYVGLTYADAAKLVLAALDKKSEGEAA